LAPLHRPCGDDCRGEQHQRGHDQTSSPSLLDSVVAVAAQLWSETVKVQDSLPTPRFLLVCTRWCLHQFREVTLLSPHKRSGAATVGIAALVKTGAEHARLGWLAQYRPSHVSGQAWPGPQLSPDRSRMRGVGCG
jgi:hypothetical protein